MDINKDTDKKFKLAPFLWLGPFLSMMIFNFIILKISGEIFDLERYFFCTFYFITNGSLNVILVGFCMQCFGVHRRFNVLNTLIEQNFQIENENDEIILVKDKNFYEKIAIKIAHLHDKLNDVLAIINRNFSTEVMMIVASIFLKNIFCIFGIYRMFARNDFSNMKILTIQIVWNIYFYAYCIAVNVLCDKLTKSGKFSAVLCHKVVNFSDDSPTIERVSLLNFSNFSLSIKYSLNYSSNYFHNKCVIVLQLYPVDSSISTFHCYSR